MRAAPDPYAEGQRLSAAGRHHEAIGHFEQVLGSNPKDTRALFALGNTARSLGMPGAAEDFYRRVLALEPDRLEALVNLANLLRNAGRAGTAEALLRPALARNPDSPEVLLTLGSARREQGETADAERFYRAALELRPDYPEALGNLADLFADAGQVDEALVLYDRVLKRDGGNAQARLNRAVLNLLKGNLKDGWRDYAARLKIPGKVPVPEHVLPRWSGEPLKRKRLLVTAEQGVGDQAMFASVIPDLIARAEAEGGSVVLECEPRLVSLFARSFPKAAVHAAELTTVGGVTRASYGWLKPLGGANLAVEMGSVPRLVRASHDSFTAPHRYFVPDASELAHWRASVSGEGPHIGVCWRSGKSGGLRDLQYAPLESWAAFLRDLAGTPVCVQYDATADEIATLNRLSGRTLAVPQGIDQKHELDRATALYASLDAVVTAPTAVAWFAAATGTPTFKILRDTSWTSFGHDHEPFAPSCRCVGCDTSGNWPSAFAQAKALLSGLV